MVRPNTPNRKFFLTPSLEGFCAGILILLGSLLRLRQYLTGRSLWLDEAMLALNVIQRDFAGLFQPLSYDQGAPIGFLLIEKALVSLFGDHEYVLRLFPFLAGIASLGLFYLLLRQLTSGAGLLIGLALFAAGPSLVYYSSEVKQYSVDVAVTTGLLLLSTNLFKGHTGRNLFFWLGFAGVFALWCSHPALFTLAGIGVGLLLKAFRQKERSLWFSTVAIGSAWLLNLGASYFVSLRSLQDNTFLLEFWQDHFLPLPPWSNPGWFPSLFRNFIQSQIGIAFPIFFALALVTGWVFLLKRYPTLAIAIAGIFIFALLASALRIYPLGGRLSLYLVPPILILVSHFISGLYERLRSKPVYSAVFTILASMALLYSPLVETFHNFINPKYFEHMRPTMATLSQNWQPGDVLFVSNGALPAYLFYAERYGIDGITPYTSEASDYSNPETLAHRLDPLSGNSRAWILLSHVYEKGSFNEREFLLNTLNRMGEQRREFREPGTSVYLYLFDLSR